MHWSNWTWAMPHSLEERELLLWTPNFMPILGKEVHHISYLKHIEMVLKSQK